MDIQPIPFAPLDPRAAESRDSSARAVRWTAVGTLCGNETFAPNVEWLVTRRNGIRPIPFEPAEPAEPAELSALAREG